MKTLFLSLVLSVMSQSAFANVPQLNCDPEFYEENGWILMVDVDGQVLSKADVMRTLMLVSGDGFSIHSSMGGPFDLLMLYVKFDPGYIGDPVRAQKVRTDVITELVGIRGNILECNAWATGNPSIGARN
jgi:hypothetical protein